MDAGIEIRFKCVVKILQMLSCPTIDPVNSEWLINFNVQHNLLGVAAAGDGDRPIDGSIDRSTIL